MVIATIRTDVSESGVSGELNICALLVSMTRQADTSRMCFDGGSSYSGYGHVGFDRRVRVYKLSAWGEKVESYKRTTKGEVIDKQVLVEPIG